MNKNIQKLYSIAQKEERLIIGLMSGTSLDGLDVALCNISGEGLQTKLSIRAFETSSYDISIKKEIREVFAKEQIDLQHLCLLNEWIGNLHGQIILDLLNKWKIEPSDIDLIASHGQTVFHAPKSFHKLEKFPNATLQIGDGDHVAVKTGIITLSDFRQKHIAAGGEGAPLAVYGDYILFSKKNEDRIMLNIGGIANFTFLAGDLDPLKMFSTDVGPGNTLIDTFVRVNFNDKSYDANGEIANSGNVNEALLSALKSNAFFKAPFPKTTGPELFNIQYVQQALLHSDTIKLPVEDLIATLTRFSAECIAEVIRRLALEINIPVIYLSGGGMHNPALIGHLRTLLPKLVFKDTAELNILPDAKEAVLFAVLANESIAGGRLDFGNNRKGTPNISMGKVSFPY